MPDGIFEIWQANSHGRYNHPEDRRNLPLDAGFEGYGRASADTTGTARFGTDPATSVLDTNCRAHEVDNLYVVDGSFFPSSSAVNPALTIIARAASDSGARRMLAAGANNVSSPYQIAGHRMALAAFDHARQQAAVAADPSAADATAWISSASTGRRRAGTRFESSASLRIDGSA